MIIIDALNYYNNIKQINTKNEIIFTEQLHNLLPVLFIKENNIMTKKIYNIIGIYDKENEIFTWAWATNILNKFHIKTNQLILHGVNLESTILSDMYIKKILTTSSIKIESDYQLQIILAISNYLTKTHYTLLASELNIDIFYGLYDIKDVENIELKVDL